MAIGQKKTLECTDLGQKPKPGLIFAGKVNSFNKTFKITLYMLIFNALHNSTHKFWDIEEMKEQKFVSVEEYKAELHFK
jgi:hypothetical protein